MVVASRQLRRQVVEGGDELRPAVVVGDRGPPTVGVRYRHLAGPDADLVARHRQVEAGRRLLVGNSEPLTRGSATRSGATLARSRSPRSTASALAGSTTVEELLGVGVLQIGKDRQTLDVEPLELCCGHRHAFRALLWLPTGRVDVRPFDNREDGACSSPVSH